MNNNHGKIQELRILFKKCLDILRNDAEHLIGDETLNELSYFLILKQSEKHILNGSIDIYNLKYYSEGLCEYGEKFFIENLEYVKFSNLVKYVKIQVNECNIKNLFDNFIWNEVLSKHPKFKDVFEDGKKSFIRQPKTIKKIVIALGDIDFDKYDLDILGEAYESIFVDAVFGAGGNKKSELGQFFTPPKVKNLLVNLVDPKIKENGEIESVLDPASGTGGILNSVIKHFSSKIHDKEKLRKQLIDNIYGIEIKGKIFNLCLSNMLINTGEILPKVICSDSIRQFHNIKIDNIIANPPFSVTIKYEDLLSSLGSLEILDDYIPIKTGGKNSEMLFLQMMIHCLNINGRCATVMLDGHKMYGSSSGYDKVREYLMRSCDLHEVILCPSGTFTSTASKTCILFFTKKKERAEVLEISGTKRTLKFLDDETHSTVNVKFYNFNPDTEEKEFIKDVGIEEIASRKYSLNHTEYTIKEENKPIEESQWKELCEVCDFLPKSKRPASYGNKTGKYPFYKSSNKLDSYVDDPDYDIESLIIGDGGEPNINYGTLFSCSDHCFILTNNDSLSVNLKYVYYYIYFNLYKLDDLYTGAAMKNISKSKVSTINIPIPTIEKQREIVLYVDSNNDIINQLQKEIENNKTIADMFLKEIVDKMNQSEVKEVIEDETEIILVEDDVKKSNIRPKLKKKQAFVVKKEEKYVEKEEEDNQSVISVVSRCSEFKCAYRNRKGETCSIKPRVNPNYCSKHSPKTKCYQ
jgi:type I restriction-modification system DNA methylase subunit